MTNGTSQGLFVIIAVVIFGIFVGISYLLFQDKLQTGLTTIFDDSLEQSFKSVARGDNDSDEDKEESLIYKIRSGNGSSISDVWVKTRVNSDNTLTIVSSNNVDTNISTYVDESNKGTSSNIKGGSLSIPSNLGGKKVTAIDDNAFISSTFTGSFSAPSVEYVGDFVFVASTFTGNFDAPNLVSTGESSFSFSKFTGSFSSPNLKNIGESSFSSSKFTGNFNANNVNSIGISAFRSSTFTGDFNAPIVTTIEDRAFQNSKFTGKFNAPKINKIGNYSFTESNFKNTFYAPNVITIGTSAFEKSEFTGDLIATNVTSIGMYAFRNSNFVNVNVPKSSITNIYTIKKSDGTYYY